MIRVLHILPTLDPRAGGISAAVKGIIGCASDTGFVHEVLCLDDASEDYLKKVDFAVHALGRGFSAWGYHSGLKAWLRAFLWKYDRVLVHGLWQYQSYAVASVWPSKHKSGAKLYVMPHGMLDPYFQKAKGRYFKALRNLLFWQLVEKRLVNGADGLLFTCKDEERLASGTFMPYRPKQTSVVGLAVQEPPGFMAHESPGFLLFLGRIHPKKGIDLLIEAYLGLQREMAPLPKLMIAGPGMESAYGTELLLQAGDNPDILFVGMLEGEAKWKAIYGCNAFILPSHQENFGIAVVEAMACGRPVLISDKVNICTDIRDGRAGLVVPDRSLDVYMMLKYWLTMGKNVEGRFGLNARVVYESKFSETVAGNTMKSLLSA